MITRACYLLECAQYVHQCNRGQWPAWLKMNLHSTRSNRASSTTPATGSTAGGLNQQQQDPTEVQKQRMQQRKTQLLQLQASKMFYQWAEVSSMFGLLFYALRGYVYVFREGPFVVQFFFCFGGAEELWLFPFCSFSFVRNGFFRGKRESLPGE